MRDPDSHKLPESKTLGRWLVRQRMTLGITQKEAVAKIGVHQWTLVQWERWERKPEGAHGDRVRRLLDAGDSGRKAQRAG